MRFSYMLNKVLKSIYRKRKRKNPMYSLRAFSRDIGIQNGRLSQYFSGKRKLTEKVAKNISDKLKNEPEKEILAGQNRQSLAKNIPQGSLEHLFHPNFFAMLSYFECDHQFDEDKIAHDLGFDSQEVRRIISILKEKELLVDVEGSLTLNQYSISTVTDVPSQFLRDAQKLRLNRIVENIDLVSLNRRSVTSSTLCIDPKKIDEAKKRIDAFMDSMADLLESGEQSEVYELNVQLFPWRVQE